VETASTAAMEAEDGASAIQNAEQWKKRKNVDFYSVRTKRRRGGL